MLIGYYVYNISVLRLKQLLSQPRLKGLSDDTELEAALSSDYEEIYDFQVTSSPASEARELEGPLLYAIFSFILFPENLKGRKIS